MHQPSRRVIDEHEPCALPAAILEPPVLTAVDLDKLAKAAAPAAGLGECTFVAAGDRATAWLRSSTSAMSRGQVLSHEPRAASRPLRSGRNPHTTRGSSPAPLAATPRACARCSGDRGASRSGPPDPQSVTSSTVRTPDGALASAVCGLMRQTPSSLNVTASPENVCAWAPPPTSIAIREGLSPRHRLALPRSHP
jgi:hypothetical protein